MVPELDLTGKSVLVPIGWPAEAQRDPREPKRRSRGADRAGDRRKLSEVKRQKSVIVPVSKSCAAGMDQ